MRVDERNTNEVLRGDNAPDVVEHSALGGLIFDGTGQIVWTNRALEALTGQPRTAFIGGDLPDAAGA